MEGISNQKEEKLPRHIFKDGAKWLLVPSKVVLDSLCVWPERQNWLTAIINIVIIMGYIAFIVGQIFYVTGESVGLGPICYALSLLVVMIETTSRRVLAWLYNDRLAKLLSKVYYDFWPSTIAGEELDQEVTQGSRYMFIILSGYTIAAFLSCMQYILVPYFDGNLPFRTAYPFPWKESPYYELLYVYQGCLSLELAFIVCGMDLFFLSLLFNCVAQFKLLRTYLVKHFEDIMKNPDRPPKEAMQFLVSCIRKHQDLIWACDEINYIFNYYILVQFLSSIATVCLSSFVATVVKEDISSSFTFLMGHLGEILLYCYMGNELILESAELSSCVFRCGWHLSYTEQDLQKSLVLIMLRSQKPIRISAGGFGYLSLPSFMKLIQFSFSVYTLLSSLINKQSEAIAQM